MTQTEGEKLSSSVALIPIMRAGLGMVEPMLELLPMSDGYHIGMYRSKGSLLPVQYYNKLPRDKSADVGECEESRTKSKSEATN